MLTLAGELPRNVMELMRHSDMRLTAKTYTDANMLPLSAAIAKLPQITLVAKDTVIGTLFTVIVSSAVSASVPPKVGKQSLLAVGEETFSPFGPHLSELVQKGKKMRDAGFESNPRRSVAIFHR